jgi:tetratricopeptide (TPR) repeat protein
LAEPYRPKLQPWRASKAGLCANCGSTLLVEEVPPDAASKRLGIVVTCPGCGTQMQGTAHPWHKLSPEEAQAKRRLQAIKDYNDHWRWKAEQSRKTEGESARLAVPEAVARLLSQGEVLHQEGRFHDALARAEQALALAPGAAQAWQQKGMVLSDLSQDEAALRAFEQANQLDPTDVIGIALPALPLYRQGQIEPAMDILDQAIAQAPRAQRAKLYHIKADMLWQVDRAAEALEACDQAMRLDP